MSEPDRHELYRSLEKALGKKPTETFMSLVPRVPWDRLATKRDLEEHQSATKRDLSELGDRLCAEFRADLYKALRGQLLAFAAILAAFNGTVFAALKLT